MAEASSTANNGVNVAALIAAREALTKAPAAAQFKWRAVCEWKDGTHSRSTVEGFYGLGQEQHHKKTFTFDADHPEIFASEDKGATPGEYVLVGLASCLTRRYRRGSAIPKHSTALGHSDHRRGLGRPRHSRHRRRHARNGTEWHQGDLQDRRGCKTRRYRSSRRAIAEAIGSL